MMRPAFRLVAAALLYALLEKQAGAAVASRPGSPPQYQAIRAALRKSAIPVLLPAPIPVQLGTIRSVTVISADANGYYVAFSPVATCGGALSCAFFHVAGTPLERDREVVSGNARRVRLADGSPAVFRPEDCSGSSCTEATLTFDRGKGSYELDVKSGGDDERVLKAAYSRLRTL